MNSITNTNKIENTVTMTSVELVEFINSQRSPEESALRHDHFMTKVPKVLGENLAPKFLGISEYINGAGHPVPRSVYLFPKREACLMAMSYSYELQAKVFDRMTELEKEKEKTKVAELPQDYITALEHLLASKKAEQLAIAQRDDAIATKAEIGNRREATAMNTASQAVKKANSLEIQLDKSKEYSTIKRMEMLYHGTKFSWRLLKSTAVEMGVEPIDVFDQNYGTVKAYHASVWLEAYALSISGDKE